jgi:hypothetical protein
MTMPDRFLTPCMSGDPLDGKINLYEAFGIR